MKRFAFLVASAAMFVFGISAFAYGNGGDYHAPISVSPANQNQSVMPTQQWVGMTGDQLVQQMGKPDSMSVSATGDKIYNYDTTAEYGQHERTTRLAFDISSTGAIMSENSSIF